MKQVHLLLSLALCFLSINSINGQFGISNIAGTFSSGVSTVAKAPGSAIGAIASIPGKVIPGGGSENATTTPSSTNPTSVTAKESTSSVSVPEIPETTPALTTLESNTEDQNVMMTSTSNSTGEEGGATTVSSSWVPGAIKKPFEAVVAVPNKVVGTAGGAWDTITETVVNHDPVHGVKFYFYDDPKDLTKYKQIVIGQPDTLRDIQVAPNSRLNILIHGFMQDLNSSFPQQVKDALLLHIGGPVVCVDWGHMADGKFGPEVIRTLLYPFIVDNVPRVGEYVGEFVVFLKNNSVISDYDQVHIIGFSLGGHVSGIAGWTVQNRTDGEKVARITGLDPAGPKFFLKTKERKLNQDDAKFVDVIHTSHLGYFLSLGHLDFFPNGGKIQPGCIETEESITDAVASLGSVLTGSCSHARAWQYYTKSIQDNDLFGCECNNIFKYELTGCEVECEDKVPFGEPAPEEARGAYFLSI